MRLVFFPTADTDDATLDSLMDAASDLMSGDSCTVIEAGEAMTAPAAGGSCFELHTSETGPDSLYTLDTSGTSGVAVYAQHFPIEFERDAHYFFDASGDIEPIVEEGGGGDHGHSHDSAGDQCGSPFDYTNDGVVGVDDLLALLASYGDYVTPCPATGR